MRNVELDGYFEELLESNLANTNPSCYNYLRRIAQHLAFDGTLAGYAKFKKQNPIGRKLHAQYRDLLPRSTKLGLKIFNLDWTASVIRSKGMVYYLETYCNKKNLKNLV